MNMFQTSRTVLFGDCDPAGVIFTPRVAYYVVETLMEFHSHLLGAPAARAIFALGVLPPARKLSIEFLAPLTFDERMQISASVLSIGETSFTCAVEAVRQDGQVAFRAELTQVCVSPESKRPTPLPEKLREALVSYQRSG